jgi:NAD(P)-dependent dehydrogenase (short-subunit alcohol dehydrogenase family)
VEKYGAKALIILCDVAYADQVEGAAEQTEKEFGPIDVWGTLFQQCICTF